MMNNETGQACEYKGVKYQKRLLESRTSCEFQRARMIFKKVMVIQVWKQEYVQEFGKLS
jgi:hypothetical protein